MKRICVWGSLVLVLAGLIVAWPSLSTLAAPSDTLVCGALAGDTLWAESNSPYVVCAAGVTVPAGISLTVEPGVTVQFESDSRLVVYGEIEATGTTTDTIAFTGMVASPGSWRGILDFSSSGAPASITLDHVIFDYAGLGSYSGAQVYANYANLTVTNSLFRDGAGSGLFHEGNGEFVVDNTTFEDNANDAIRMSHAQRGLNLSGLTATGNGRDVVFIDSTTNLNGRHHWPAAGLPYLVDAAIQNFPGDSLTIDPGNELQFTAFGQLAIGGELKAIGLPDTPIILTGAVKTPGSWAGLEIYGGVAQAIAQLDYVTVEYGGSGVDGANISVTNGYLVARHSVIRHSEHNGVRFDTRGTGSILNSRIEGNATYGVRNTQPLQAVLATNNWWGDASGPKPDQSVCGQGLGDSVTAGVLFRPFLDDPDTTALFPLSDAPSLTLTPRRWFAPADGTTRIYFDIQLKDGNGLPMPGRTVRLSSSLGTVTDGGITDIHGHTFGYLVSGATGDADVTAALDPESDCEAAMSPTSEVTFNPPLDVTELFPDSPAPYFDGRIKITPLPVITGVPTTIEARLTNPLPEPITVDISVGFRQSGVGLAFGPLEEINDHVIPANSTELISVPWVPVVSGYYCLQVSYTITAIGDNRVTDLRAGGSGLQQYNVKTQQGPQGPPGDKDSLKKADNAWNTVSQLTPKPLKIQKAVLNGWWGWAKDASSTTSEQLGGDPPRQDYDQFTEPVWHTWPDVQPNANISQARAAAMNAASADLADVNAYGAAAALALDRYGGATEAHELQWAAQQANARLYYERLMGEALWRYAESLDAFIQVLIDEGETDLLNTRADVIDYQQRLETQGFTQQELADAHLVGLSDDAIEAHRLEIIAADPADLTGNILDFYKEEADASRALGNALIEQDSYAPALSVGAGRALSAAATSGNVMAQIYNVTSTIEVGNPLAESAVIDLRARRIDLPADWGVSVQPAQVTLEPGEATTVTVSILTGSLISQGSVPRVAVEGYAGDEFLGGVVVEVVVPRYVLFDGNRRVFLPLVNVTSGMNRN